MKKDSPLKKEIIWKTENWTVYKEKNRLVGKEKKYWSLSENNLAFIQKIGASVKDTIKSGISKIEKDITIKESERVVVKINIGGGITGLYGTYSEPEILEGIILAVKELGGKPLVGEADMRGRKMGENLLKRRGYMEVLKRTDTPFVNLSNTEAIEFKCLDLELPLLFPKILLDPNTCLISFAPIKYHWECGVTLSQKNMYGALSEGKKFLYHQDVTLLDKVIAASSRIMSPSINILGGRILSSGLGPHFSVPVDFNYLIFSNHPWVADKIGADILGYPYEKVRYAMINSKQKKIAFTLLEESDKIPATLIHKIRKFKIKPEDTIFWRNFLALQYHIPEKMQRVLANILEPPFALMNAILFSWRGRIEDKKLTKE